MDEKVIFSHVVVCEDFTMLETLVLCIWAKNGPENIPNKSPVALLLHQSLVLDQFVLSKFWTAVRPKLSKIICPMFNFDIC